MGMCSKQNLFIGMAVVWVASLVFDVHRQPRLGHNWYVYKLVMLTNLNFVLDVFYSVLVAAASKSRVLRQIADFMYYTSVFPVGVVTCGLFWGLYYIDPALVMPEWIAKLIPTWLNHITHTYPIIYILLDSYFHRRNAPGTITCWIVSATLVFIYFMIIGYVRFYDGYWLYPILQLFSIQHFVLSYFLAFFGFFLLTKAAYFLNKMMHRTRYPATTGGARKVNKKRH
ncbi:hypothetical protein B9Z55_022434 [Caenorhabditis nigoni]|uniref:FAR-17a/AIG1-like protein n=1 Tax=Caenorhabditis nigoni TaxID=1611254 RepID=A0A2G5SKN9_9PELO|nr:hypothetical protein B9Z55_022434 [Caenorhabditis nigoni]